jgi:hypothetical protein
MVAPNPGLAPFKDFLHANHEIQDQATHHALHEDLLNHIWIHVGNNPVTNPFDFRNILFYCVVNYFNYLVANYL